MFISDLSYLEITSENLVGGSSYKRIKIRQKNDNYTDQYAKAVAKGKYGDADADNDNYTDQSNSVRF
jgi:hypothetical protein